jgi:PII-like signaling protein
MKVTVARIYVTEGRHIHEKVFQRLHDDHKVMGVTVYRGVTGFGKSGETHASALLDLSFDLPVVVEFFDTAENVKAALGAIGDLIAPGHVLTFPADFS